MTSQYSYQHNKLLRSMFGSSEDRAQHVTSNMAVSESELLLRQHVPQNSRTVHGSTISVWECSRNFEIVQLACASDHTLEEEDVATLVNKPCLEV
jgi:hypothetical protein